MFACVDAGIRRSRYPFSLGVSTMRAAIAAAVLCAAMSASVCFAQTTPLRFKLERDGSALTTLTPAELGELGDPLFNLVLKDHANLLKLADVEAAIQPDASELEQV